MSRLISHFKYMGSTFDQSFWQRTFRIICNENNNIYFLNLKTWNGFVQYLIGCLEGTNVQVESVGSGICDLGQLHPQNNVAIVALEFFNCQ